MGADLSRRAFLGATGTAASVALAPRLAAAAGGTTRAPDDIECEAAVVGAGFAGLAAAHTLLDSGVSVVALEARDRVGGRARDQRASGAILPLGAVGIHAGHERVRSLAARAGVVMLPRAVGTAPTFDGEVQRTLERLERMSAEVGSESPWSAASARSRDGRTLQSWIDDTVAGRDARATLVALARAVWATDPAEVSLLHALATVASAAGTDRLVEVALAPTPVAGGVQRLGEVLAARLGDRLRLAAPVRRIEQRDDAVLLTAEGVTVRASRVIVTLPPGLTGAVEWVPELPASRRQLALRLPLAGSLAFACAYSRGAGSGLAGGALGVGPLSGIRAVGSSGGALVVAGQLVGSAAREWSARGAVERRRAVLDALAEALGGWAGNPVEYAEADWQADGLAGGGIGVPLPGTLASLGPAMRTPVGRVHWAGAEIATEWTGTLEGAVTSGERAAREVLAALGRARRGLGVSV